MHQVLAMNGDDALAYLRRQGRHAGARRPQLILLDLNLPGRDGREILEEIKNDRQLLHIPVVVLTTSGSDRDVQRAYESHANCFINQAARTARVPPRRPVHRRLLAPDRPPAEGVTDMEHACSSSSRSKTTRGCRSSPHPRRKAADGAAITLECVPDLTAGMARLGAGGVDAVLLDLNLPDSSGLDSLRAIAAGFPAVPIVVLTGLDDDRTGLAAVNSGRRTIW